MAKGTKLYVRCCQNIFNSFKRVNSLNYTYEIRSQAYRKHFLVTHAGRERRREKIQDDSYRRNQIYENFKRKHLRFYFQNKYRYE